MTHPENQEALSSTTAEPVVDVKPGVPRRPRGFAAMDRTKVSEIARKGGIAAHQKGTAHEYNSETARIAGKKGGAVSRKRAKGVSSST